MFISTVWRRMKPRLSTTRRSVTAISVVQRRNQARRKLTSAAKAANAATTKTATPKPAAPAAKNVNASAIKA